MSDGQAGKRVLVVDDMSTVRKALRRMLESEGVEVFEASDAELALMMLVDQQVDAFLLDIQLPGMDGIELCRRLRTMERFQFAPILFITGMEQDDVLARAFEVGGDDVISKPVSPTLLTIRLKNYLRRANEAAQLDYITRSMNRYVCPRTQAVVAEYAETGFLAPPHEDDVCVLFTDVRGFTQMSQHIPPKTLFNVLSEHLGAQVRLVYRYGGYIDKFSGDGLMAVFDGPDQARNSCLCALKIAEYAREQSIDDETALHQLGIGIHHGRAMIGNIGSDKQLDYTVIGPTVNLAARLCGHAEAMSVVVSASVHHALVDDLRFKFSEPRYLSVKGIEAPVAAYNLTRGLRLSPPQVGVEEDALPE